MRDLKNGVNLLQIMNINTNNADNFSEYQQILTIQNKIRSNILNIYYQYTNKHDKQNIKSFLDKTAYPILRSSQ